MDIWISTCATFSSTYHVVPIHVCRTRSIVSVASRVRSTGNCNWAPCNGWPETLLSVIRPTLRDRLKRVSFFVLPPNCIIFSFNQQTSLGLYKGQVPITFNFLGIGIVKKQSDGAQHSHFGLRVVPQHLGDTKVAGSVKCISDLYAYLTWNRILSILRNYVILLCSWVQFSYPPSMDVPQYTLNCT